jgi:mannan endo-1,4-beta-mannosidase
MARYLVLWLVSMSWFCSAAAWAGRVSAPGYVRVEGLQFRLDGEAFPFVGANLWYALHLGIEVQRPRLERELDRLQTLGVTTVRLLASGEGPNDQPIRVRPALQSAPGVYDADLLAGLDFVLVELAKRKMKAILVLANFWEWSGGLGQYLVWAGFAERIPYPPPLDGDFDSYQKFVAQFYAHPVAREYFARHVRSIVERRNSLSSRVYRDDPTILAWELCSEPRAMNQPLAFHRWIGETAALIRSLDPYHLITVGSEGDTPHPQYSNGDYTADHAGANIDFGTIHIWPENFGWYDPRHPEETFEKAWQKTQDYIRTHIAKAQGLGKPMILEEFGLARDGGSHDPEATVQWRDRYYERVLDEVYRAAKGGTPLVGAMFWAWSGEGRPKVPGKLWQEGDDLLGDPPHEAQGWYGIYDQDRTTLALLRRYATAFHQLDRYESRTCSDQSPSKSYSCAQQKAWNKCGESWMVPKGYCLMSCGVCYEGVESTSSLAL